MSYLFLLGDEVVMPLMLTKIQTSLGWTPLQDFTAGLRKTVQLVFEQWKLKKWLRLLKARVVIHTTTGLNISKRYIK